MLDLIALVLWWCFSLHKLASLAAAFSSSVESSTDVTTSSTCVPRLGAVVFLPSQTRFSCRRFFFLGRKQHRRHHIFHNTPLLFARLLLLTATQAFPPPHLAGMKMKLFPKRNGHRGGCVIVPVFQIEFDRQQHEKSAGRWFSFQLWPEGKKQRSDSIPSNQRQPHQQTTKIRYQPQTKSRFHSIKPTHNQDQIPTTTNNNHNHNQQPTSFRLTAPFVPS